MEIITMIAYVATALAVLFGGIAWMIHVQISPVKELLVKTEQAIQRMDQRLVKNEQTTLRIDQKLGNHITDTNKKIEILSGRIDKLADRFDKMSDRLDRQSDQFCRLYEILIKIK